MSWAAGALLGPLWGGVGVVFIPILAQLRFTCPIKLMLPDIQLVRERIGLGGMGWTLGLLSIVTALPTYLLIGGWRGWPRWCKWLVGHGREQ